MISAPQPTCLVCGGDNDCDLSAGKGSCWCFHETVHPELLRLLESRGIDRACLCARCAAGNVPSPCVRTCELDARSGTCRGCSRTMDEIVDWPVMGALARARVLQRLRGD